MGYQKVDGRSVKRVSRQRPATMDTFEADDANFNIATTAMMMIRMRHQILLDLLLERLQGSQPV